MNEHLRQDAALHGGDRPEQRASRVRALLYSRSEDGHRAAFIDFFSRLLGGERAGVPRLVTSGQPVLFLMIEEAFWLYVLLAVGRAILGRRTVGFLFRPQQALNGQTLRLSTKRALLRIMRRIPAIQTLTILPFAIEPRFAEIADGWIDDPQQWDLSPADIAQVEQLRQRPSGLTALIRERAGSRPVVCAIGRQDRSKGFGQFVKAALNDTATSQLFVCGGRVSDELQSSLAELTAAGGMAINRRVEDSELLELYAAADIVWSCYAPDYDQSSGVLGRAAQLGIPAIVRHGSLLQRLCEAEGIAHVQYAGGSVSARTSVDPRRGQKMRQKMRERSLEALWRALSGAPANTV